MGFIVTVDSFIEQNNFGGTLGRQAAFKCRIWGNTGCQHAVYPTATFDANFKPYVKPAPQPAAPKQEPAAVAVETKAQV